MQNLEMWSLIVGFLLPIVIAFVQQEKWPARVRSIVMLIVCILAACGTTFFSGHFNPTDIVTSVLLIIVTAIGTYKGVWQPTGVAPVIEHLTTPNHSATFHADNKVALDEAKQAP